ncbi:putative importin, partial [Dictyocoela roeselum]
GPAVLGKFAFYLRAKNYEFVKMIMTVFMQAHEGFNIPKFMTQIGNFSSIVGMATSILKDVTDAYDNWQARKCASSFLCKALNRSIKVYYKNKLMGEYILETARLTEIYSVVKLIFGSNKDTKETIYNAVEFILLLSAEAKYFPLIYDDIFFLIFEVILPSHVLSDEEQREFKEQPDAYLKSKYNYYANDIRCSAGALFAEIINQIAEKPELFS